MDSFFKYPISSILIVSILVGVNLACLAQETSQQIIDFAKNLRDQQAHQRAYQVINLLRTNQQTIESLQLRASLEVQLDKKHEAILTLNTIIAIDNSYLEAYFQRGKLFLDINLNREAELDFTYVIDHQNQDTKSILFKTSESGDEQVKIQSLQQMIPEVYIYRAISRERLGQLVKAADDFQNAIELDSASDRFIDRALFYSRQQQKEKAIVDIRKALYLDQSNAKAWYNLLLLEPETVIPAHIEFGEFRPLLEYKVIEAILQDEALLADKLLSNLIIMAPEDDALLVLQGRVAYLNKDYQRAEQFYQSAIDEVPHLKEVYFLLGNLYFQTKRYEEAIDSYLLFLVFDPENAKVNYNLANAYFVLKQDEKGCEYLLKTVVRGFELNEKLRKKCLEISEGF